MLGRLVLVTLVSQAMAAPERALEFAAFDEARASRAGGADAIDITWGGGWAGIGGSIPKAEATPCKKSQWKCKAKALLAERNALRAELEKAPSQAWVWPYTGEHHVREDCTTTEQVICAVDRFMEEANYFISDPHDANAPEDGVVTTQRMLNTLAHACDCCSGISMDPRCRLSWGRDR